MSNLISLEKWCSDTGFPKTTFRGWRPKLVKGKHYVKIGRVVAVDPVELDLWLRESGGETEHGSSSICAMETGTIRQGTSQKPKLVSRRQ